MGVLGRESAEAVLACPRDSTAMAKLTRESITVDTCGTCGGFWFDAKELRAFAQDKDVEKLASRVGEFPRASPLACPRCGAGCVGSHVGEVEVDTCPKCHGVWLDRGELEEAKREAATRRVLDSASAPGFRSFLDRL